MTGPSAMYDTRKVMHGKGIAALVQAKIWSEWDTRDTEGCSRISSIYAWDAQ